MFKKYALLVTVIIPSMVLASDFLDAIENNNITQVRNILERSSVNKDQKEEGLTLAAELGYLKIVEYLLKHGANPNAQRDDGFTALILATTNEHPDVVKLLIQYKADVNEPDFSNTTALMYARQEGLSDIEKILIEAGGE